MKKGTEGIDDRVVYNNQTWDTYGFQQEISKQFPPSSFVASTSKSGR